MTSAAELQFGAEKRGIWAKFGFGAGFEKFKSGPILMILAQKEKQSL